MSVDNQELLQRLELEISKYMDIATIFRRLKDQSYLSQIHTMFHKIFNNEHQYTLKELVRMAQTDPSGFDIAEHYKMNSHIFKQNLILISNLVIDDLWVTFNATVQDQGQFDTNTHHSLERIEELSTEQAQFDSKISRIQSNYNDTDHTPNEETENQNNHHSSAKQRSNNKVNKHVQEYKEQLKMIQNMRPKNDIVVQKNQDNLLQNIQLENQQSSRNVVQNLSGSSIKINSQSRPAITQNLHTKSPSYEKSQLMESNITPTQQNYKTMQFLNQFISKSTKDEQQSILQFNHDNGAIAFNNLKTKIISNQKELKFEQHFMAINQQENFNQKLQKRQILKSGKKDSIK